MGNLSTGSVRRVRGFTVFMAASLLVSLLAVRAQAEDPLDPFLGDPGRTYPNLVPNVEDVQVQTFRFTETGFETGQFLWFDTRAQNMGAVPVQITVDEVEDAESSTVSQCVSWRNADAHLCRETEVVGGYTWHDAHTHFHYEDFARYELRRFADDGRPDYSSAGLVRQSSKVSFCFIDSERVKDDARPTPLYETCLPTVQGITPGWTDIYTSDLEGQNFEIAGVPNGTYALIIDMDYEDTLYETSQDDNFLVATLTISSTTDPNFPAGKKAEISDRQWPTPSERINSTTTTTTLPGRTPPPRDPDWRPPGWPS